MPRLFIANFDFEHRLACGEGTLPGPVARINAELAPVWAAVATDGDQVWTPTPIDSAIFDRLAAAGLPRLRAVTDPTTVPGWHELVFWGENEWAGRMARQWRLRWDGADAAAVRRVNSRRFAFGLERALDVALPGAALAETTAEVAAAVAGLSDGPGWVLKGEFGNAGREVRFGRGPLTPMDERWAGNRFRRGTAVLVEPRLDAVEECGVQFAIGRGGEVEFLGVSPLQTRPDGGYVGSGFADDPAVTAAWADAVGIAGQIAEAAAAAGYFGPLGVDAMRYRTADGTLAVRPVQDINGRYTMGRMALGLRRFPGCGIAPDGLFRPSDFRAAALPQTAAVA